MYTYPIDFELFSQKEAITLIEFLSLIEDVNERQKVDPNVIRKKYMEFKKIVNSIAMEKQIDRDFKRVSGYSIFQTMKKFN